MNPNSFPDGFPKDPLQAIEYSYFFSEEEKQDWRNWLQTAPVDQRDELVDILHNMWTEQQKQAVPAGFNNPAPANPAPTPAPQQTSSAPQPAPAPEPQAQQVSPAPVAPEPAAAPLPSIDSDFDQAIKDLEAELARQEVPAPGIPSVNFDDEIEENVKNFSSDNYSPNPLLESIEEEAELELPSPAPKRKKKAKTKTKQAKTPSFEDQFADMSNDATSNPASAQQSNQGNNTTQAEPKFFEVAKVRETATKKELEQIYQTYLSTRSQASSNKKAFDEAHATFLDKVMRVVVNFEQVADYFESMTSKLLEMNNKIVNNAKAMSQHKISVDKKVEELERAVEDLRDDLDRLSRKHRDLENASRDRVDELREQIAMHGADTYADQGMIARFDNLASQVKVIENNNKDLKAATKKLYDENKALKSQVKESKNLVDSLEAKLKDINARPKLTVADRVKEIAEKKQQQSKNSVLEKTTVSVKK